MKDLFRISTDSFVLDWRSVSVKQPAVLSGQSEVCGRFAITPRSANITLLEDTRKAFPAQVANKPEVEIGPALFEETDYQVYLRAKKPGDRIDLRHRDPLMRRPLAWQENGSVLHGVLNFRGQIGRSFFTVLVNGKPVVDFEVEVFPTKVDYEADYKQILADIQEILTGLAYEYLRSTFQLGQAISSPKPTRLEWLILLVHIVEELDRAVGHIIQQPRRQLVRLARTSRVERIRRVDAAIRKQVRRGLGRGALVQTEAGPIRERLVECPAESTMDTMEHRWLKWQLSEIQRTLAQLLESYNRQDVSERQQTAIEELTKMERRIARMTRAEPFREANGNVAPGFASLQLLCAPGYREAYQLCLMLKMGLRLEGEALRLSVKDLSVLYEYWVFLAMVKIIRDNYACPEGLGELFQISQSGVGVRLRQGRQQTVPFRASKNRRISVIYNPQFADHDTTLIPQKPDILIRFEEEGWPRIQLICDAKYRVDASEEYRQQYRSCGPPRDAINVLHRYRDAILEFDKADDRQLPKRSVIQAAACFPYSEGRAGQFRESRLWQSIERFGIGAIPALPNNLAYLSEWLTTTIREGGWSMADRIIPHVVEQRAIDWRIAAGEPVLVGVLSSSNAKQRLDWITQNRIFYHPLPKSPHRHFRVVSVALYSPKTLREIPAIAHAASVEAIEVRPRKQLSTPWPSRGSGDDLMLVYRLESVLPLDRPIENHSDDSTTFRMDRWTSRLGLDRAQTAMEIIFETEPEWKLYETLRARRINFEISADRVRLQSKDSPVGRAWLRLPNGLRVRYDGANGFLVADERSDQRSYHSLGELLNVVLPKSQWSDHDQSE